MLSAFVRLKQNTLRGDSIEIVVVKHFYFFFLVFKFKDHELVIYIQFPTSQLLDVLSLKGYLFLKINWVI